MDLTKMSNEDIKNYWKTLCNTFDNSDIKFLSSNDLEDTYIYIEMMCVQSEASNRNISLSV